MDLLVCSDSLKSVAEDETDFTELLELVCFSPARIHVSPLSIAYLHSIGCGIPSEIEFYLSRVPHFIQISGIVVVVDNRVISSSPAASRRDYLVYELATGSGRGETPAPGPGSTVADSQNTRRIS